MDEPLRISHIAETLLKNQGKDVAVMVDTGPGYEGKGDRYILGVRKLVPSVKVISRKPGPVPETETIILNYPDAR